MGEWLILGGNFLGLSKLLTKYVKYNKMTV